MPLSEFHYPLQFERDVFIPLALEPLAVRLQVSHSFLRLCATLGCPVDGGQMSVATVLLWLFDHYEEVRALAGLSLLAPVEKLAPDVADRLRVANALGTLLEYSRTRATRWPQKRHLRLALERVDRLADGVA